MRCSTPRFRRSFFMLLLVSFVYLMWKVISSTPISFNPIGLPKQETKLAKPVVNSISKYVVRYISSGTTVGRLGNKMFQYASMYGTAKKHNFIPVLKNDEPILSFFEAGYFLAQVLPIEFWQSLTWKTWWEPQSSSYDEKALLAGLSGVENVFMERFLQSYKYFSGLEAEIVQQFVFKQPTRNWADAYLKNVTQIVESSGKKNYTIVGVHIRRGDYVIESARVAGYNIPTHEYYLKATQYFTQRYPFVVFVICSNEITWAIDFFANATASSIAYNNTFFEFVHGEENQADKDLALLSLCNHTILSVGSYSFWAAMLRQYRSGHSDSGTSIYYTRPFVYGRPIADTYNNRTDDFYPPEWIGME